MPSAADITVAQTLGLLDGPFAEVARGVEDGQYVLWLGSGISRERVPAVDHLVARVLEFLRARHDRSRPDCPRREALEKAIAIAQLRDDELAAIDFDRPVTSWPPLRELVRGLVRRYSELLDIEVRGEERDYLVWDGIDVGAVYGRCTDPDCEHVALAVLALEGVVTEAPTPNWDGLIECAFAELTDDPADVVRVVVLPEEARGQSPKLTLFKFHGCAVKAAENPSRYRSSLVARKSQITAWPREKGTEAIRQELVSLATMRPTLMIGLSAQDANIQDIFSEATSRMRWPWPSDPPAHVFAEDQLGDDHTNILRFVYQDDYAGNEAAIAEGARVRAFSKPLLSALVLHVLAAKLRALVQSCDAAGLDRGAMNELVQGLLVLRNEAARHAEPDRLAFIRALVAAQTRTLTLFQSGVEPRRGTTVYKSLSGGPAKHIAKDPMIETSGLRELAVALALIGSGVATATWHIGLGPTVGGNEGAIKLVSAGGAEAAVYFAANGRAAIQIESLARTSRDPAEVVIIHSTDPVQEVVRSPSGRYGRGADPAPRHVDMADLLRTSSNLADFETRFRQAAAL